MDKRKVLVVDDEAGVRESLRMVLKEQYEPLLASSGEEALGMLAETRPDVVLLDIVMPGMDGLEVLEDACAPDSPRLPVIMLTATKTVKTAVDRHEARRVRLRHQAVRRRGAAASSSTRRPRTPPSCARSRSCARRSGGATASTTSSARSRAHAGGLPHRRHRRAAQDHGPDHRRERHREGADRQGDPLPEPARAAAAGHAQLRRDPREPARERAVRPRARLVHRRPREASSASSSWRTRARSSSTRSAR